MRQPNFLKQRSDVKKPSLYSPLPDSVFPTNNYSKQLEQHTIDILSNKDYLSIANYGSIEHILENVYFKNQLIAKVPINLHELINVIEKSKYILDLQKNWDGENSEPYSFEIWQAAVLLLVKYGKWILENCRKIIFMPSIYHAPNGSIDIYWETPTFNLLLNVSDKKVASYYGDDYSNNKIEGELDLADLNFKFFPILI